MWRCKYVCVSARAVCVRSLWFCNSQIILSRQVVVLPSENGKGVLSEWEIPLYVCVCLDMCQQNNVLTNLIKDAGKGG